MLLDALPSVIARHRRARLIVFGRGPRQAVLQARARRLGLERKVIFAGFVPRLETLLAGFDVFVHPARSEGLGLVVLEAFAAGVPVIASRAGGLVDAVDDERTGLLVPPGDAPALTSALLRVLENEAYGHRLARAARARVAERFSVEAMTDAYRRLYSGFVPRALERTGTLRASR